MRCSADISMGEIKEMSDEDDGEEEFGEKQRLRHVVRFLRKNRDRFSEPKPTSRILKISRQWNPFSSHLKKKPTPRFHFSEYINNSYFGK